MMGEERDIKDYLSDRLSEASSERSVGGLHMKEQRAAHTYKRLHTEGALPRRRTVTTPKADLIAAWHTFAQRRGQMQRERARRQGYTAVVLRAHAQIHGHALHGYPGTLKALPAIPDRRGRRAARRRIGWRLLSCFALASALVIALMFALTSNAFRIEQVSVRGTHNPALTEAIERLGMQGQNIFLLDIDALTERIDASPLVASVSLDKQWPNQLTVTVVERKPVLLWQTTTGTYGVDDQGMVIAAASEMTGIDHLNTVLDTGSRATGQQGNAESFLHPGSHLNQVDISFARNVFTRLPQLTGITNFHLLYNGTIYTSSPDSSAPAGSSGSFLVESSAGWVAYLGGASDPNPLENRLIELQQILALAEHQQVSLATIDLRYGLYPVYTLK